MDTIHFHFLADRCEELHIHFDVEVFYILDGSGEFTLEEQKIRMGKEDFLVINSNQKHGFQTKDEKYLGACIHFPYLTGSIFPVFTMNCCIS